MPTELQHRPAAVDTPLEPAPRPPDGLRPSGGIRFDAIAALFACWMVGGAVLDAWAHSHLASLERFFTPWHAVLYSGFLAGALFLLGTLVRNHARGYPWRRAVPAGYEPSLLGLAIVAVGGVGDGIWHTLFGIESNVDATLSPTHLALALGFGLLITGPIRAAWQRAGAAPGPGFAAWLPLIVALGLVLTLFSLITEFAQPLVATWPTNRTYGAIGQSLGVAGILLQTGILMAFVLLVLRRWALPFGAFTLLFTLNVTLISVMSDQYRLIPGVALAGLAADVLNRRLQPGPARPAALRLFAFAVPAIYYLFYDLTLELTAGIWWSIHLWLGSAVVAGIAGWLLSYLLVPPPTAEA